MHKEKYDAGIGNMDDFTERLGSLTIDEKHLSDQVDINNDSIPPLMRIHAGKGSGFFLGGLNQFKQSHYIGIPTGTEGNVLIIGGNGSGKSSAIMQTTRTWGGTFVATDIKGELSQAYADAFEEGDVTTPYLVFDPLNNDSPSYDPFWLLRQGDEADLVGNLLQLVYTLIPDLRNDINRFWTETERGVLAAALWHCFQLPVSFSDAILGVAGRPLSDLCKTLVCDEDQVVKTLLGQTAEMKPEVVANVDRGIRNTIMNIAADSRIIDALRTPNGCRPRFTWADLETHNIFLRIPDDKVEVWGPVVNLMYAQLITYLMRRPEKYSPKGRNMPHILLLMDEFPRLGKLEAILPAVTTLRSKGITICPVIQSLAQLDLIYGSETRRIILDNCQYKLILGAGDPDTQEVLSKMVGKRTYLQHGVSVQRSKNGKCKGFSTQISETRDWAIQPHEWATMRDAVIITPHGMFRIDKFDLNKDYRTPMEKILFRQ